MNQKRSLMLVCLSGRTRIWLISRAGGVSLAQKSGAGRDRDANRMSGINLWWRSIDDELGKVDSMRRLARMATGNRDVIALGVLKEREWSNSG